MRPDDATLLDIHNAARLAVQFLESVSEAGFQDDMKTQSAALHQLMIVGEAVKRLSDEFRQDHPEVPWKMIAGMRDKLIHEYDGVDLDEVWKTVKTDLPGLLKALEPLVPRQ